MIKKIPRYLANTEQLKKLFVDYPWPAYHNTPIADDIRAGRWNCFGENKCESTIVIVDDNKPKAACVVKNVDYLSDHFGFKIGEISLFAGAYEDSPEDRYIANRLIAESFCRIVNRDFDFVQCIIPIPYYPVIHALEMHGFKSFSGFLPMDGTPSTGLTWMLKREKLDISDVGSIDVLSVIEDAYKKSTFPAHLVDDKGFNEAKAKYLYVDNFRRAIESPETQVFQAQYDGNFAGAIIAKIDKKYKTSGSGMGLIVHPDYRNIGVAQLLIRHRQYYYLNNDVEYVSFGANLCNYPMINCLAKMGFKANIPNFVFHRWM